MRPTRRAVVLATLAAGLLTTATDRTARADVPPPGERGVRVEVDVAWGDLGARLVRRVEARPDDTWATFAARASGTADLAASVQALNGGGARPTGAPWAFPAVPGPVYSAFADASKFGGDVEVSRSGFRPVEPGTPFPAFGTVTVVLLEHTGPDDAARAAAMSQRAVREVRADVAAGRLRAAPPFPASIWVPEGSPAQRKVVHRKASLSADGFRLEDAGTDVFDAAGRPVGGAEGSGPGARSSFVPAVAAVLALLALSTVLVRRWRRTPPS